MNLKRPFAFHHALVLATAILLAATTLTAAA